MSREDGVIHVQRVDIGNSMLIRIPPAETKIETTHECNVTIDKAEFLVVRPVEDDVVSNSIDTFQRICTKSGSTRSIELETLK